MTHTSALTVIDEILEAIDGSTLEDFIGQENPAIIDRLRELKVHVATQPHHPLNLRVSGVVHQSELNQDAYDEYLQGDRDGDEPDMTREEFAENECSFGDKVIWLVAPDSDYDRPYAPRAVMQR